MDNQLRRLERRVATGDPNAIVQLLVARVRAGCLRQERIKLAAYLGDDVAQRACADLNINPSKKTKRWLRGIVKRCPETAPSILVICLEMYAFGSDALPTPVGGKRWTARHLNQNQINDHHFLVYVRDARLWLSDPTEENREDMRSALVAYRLWYPGEADWFARRQLPANLPELDALNGNIAKLVEHSHQDACKRRAPSYSKWGEKQVSEILEAQITAELVRWALHCG